MRLQVHSWVCTHAWNNIDTFTHRHSSENDSNETKQSF